MKTTRDVRPGTRGAKVRRIRELERKLADTFKFRDALLAVDALRRGDVSHRRLEQVVVRAVFDDFDDHPIPTSRRAVLSDVASSIVLRTTDFPMIRRVDVHFAATSVDPWAHRIRVSTTILMSVADRDHPGTTIDVGFQSPGEVVKMPSSPDTIADIRLIVASNVRHDIYSAVEHEVDECLFVAGIRAFDPHA